MGPPTISLFFSVIKRLFARSQLHVWIYKCLSGEEFPTLAHTSSMGELATLPAINSIGFLNYSEHLNVKYSAMTIYHSAIKTDDVIDVFTTLVNY